MKRFIKNYGRLLRYTLSVFFLIPGLVALPSLLGLLSVLLAISVLPMPYEFLLNKISSTRSNKVINHLTYIVPLCLFFSASMLVPKMENTNAQNSESFDLGVLFEDLLGNVFGNSKLRTIKIEEAPESLQIGSQIDVIVSTNVKDFDINSLIWSSSNELIAGVENGCITGLSEGTVIITVSSESGIKESFNLEIKDIQIKVDMSWFKRLQFIEEAKRNSLSLPYYYVNGKNDISLSDKKYKDTPYYISGHRVQKHVYTEGDKITDGDWLIWNKIGNSNYIVFSEVPEILNFPDYEAYIEIWGVLSGDFFYSTYTSLSSTIYPPIMKAKIVKVNGIIVYEDTSFFEDSIDGSRTLFYNQAKENILNGNIEYSINTLLALNDFNDSKELINDYSDEYVATLFEKIEEFSNPFLRSFDLELIEMTFREIMKIRNLSQDEIDRMDSYIEGLKNISKLIRDTDDQFELWNSISYHPDVARDLATNFYNLKVSIISEIEIINGTQLLSYIEISKYSKSELFFMLVIDKRTTKNISGEYVVEDLTSSRFKLYYITVPWESRYLEDRKDTELGFYDYEIIKNRYIFKQKVNSNIGFEAHIYK